MTSIIVLMVCAYLLGILCTTILVAYRVCFLIYGKDASLILAVQFLFGIITTAWRFK